MATDRVEIKAGDVVEGPYRRPNWDGETVIRAKVLATLVIRGSARLLVTRDEHDISDSALQVLYAGSFHPAKVTVTEGEPIEAFNAEGLYLTNRSDRYSFLSRIPVEDREMATAVYGSYPVEDVVSDNVVIVTYQAE